MSNWQKGTKNFKTIKLGSPTSFWSYGLERRLYLVKQQVDFYGKKVLDVGCGLGMFLNKFSSLSEPAFDGKVQNTIVYGIDVDKRKIEIAKHKFSNVQVARAEKLPFSRKFFDIVFSHETLEHVDDDKKAIIEALRVLKTGGKMIIFCPNKRWPFETHGIYLRGKYHFGNIFGVTYLPKFLYKKLTPHVRNYSNKDLLSLFPQKSIKIIHHSHVFPGLDGLVTKTGLGGKFIRKILEFLERTPLHYFGISHFLVVEKLGDRQIDD